MAKDDLGEWRCTSQLIMLLQFYFFGLISYWDQGPELHSGLRMDACQTLAEKKNEDAHETLLSLQ